MPEQDDECGCADRAWLVENRRTYLKHAMATALVASSAGCLGSSRGQEDDSIVGDDDTHEFEIEGPGEFYFEITGEVEPDPSIADYAEYGTHYGDDWVGFELTAEGATHWWFTGDIVELDRTDEQTAWIDGEEYEESTVVEDFERSDPLAAYGGEDHLFGVASSPVYQGSQALINDGGEFASIVSTSGLDHYPERGNEITYSFQNAAEDNFVAFHIFAQSETDDPDGYTVGISGQGAWRLWRNVDGGIETIATEDLPASEQTDGWYRAEVWTDDTTVYADLYDDATDELLASVSADDDTYDSGGIGFRSAGNGEIWDYVLDRGETDGGDDGDDLDEMKLIDAHLHLIPQTTLGRDPLLADDLVAWMDNNGVDEGVVLPLEAPEAYPVTAPSWWIFEQCEQYPDRLIPFFTVDPRKGVYGRNVIEEQFELYVEEGARGFGEFKPGLEVGDGRMDPIYELCAEYDLPILFHSDDKAFMDDLDHSQLEAVLQSYPDVDFVGHAMGWWARICGEVTEDELGGYPNRSVEPGGAVPYLLSEYDNIYGDLSGGSGWNALTRDQEFGQTFLEEHAGQIIFGTDYLYPGHDVPNFQLFDQFELDESAWRDIRYRNLESILRD